MDDFALKKRHRYGTVLINAKTGNVVDMLESREKEDVIKWLKQFTSIKVFSRDGAEFYANAISAVFPEALQVMDRFHILKHLTDYCKKFINRIISAYEPIESEAVTAQDIPVFATKYEKIMRAKQLKTEGKSIAEIGDTLFVSEQTVKKYVAMSDEYAKKFDNKTGDQISEERSDAKQKLFDDIHRMVSEGVPKIAIAKKLGVSENTVYNYLKYDEPPQRAYNSQRNRAKIEKFYPRITELIAQGMKNKPICKILISEGCSCSTNYICKNITHLRKARNAPPQRKVKRKSLISLLYRSIDKIKDLTEDDLCATINRFPALSEIYSYVRSFNELLFSKHYEKLESWLDTADKSDIPEIRSFVTGVRQDLEATKAAIQYSYNNGIAEGTVNKIKVIKRTMYGRCSFELLRAKVLLIQSI